MKRPFLPFALTSTLAAACSLVVATDDECQTEDDCGPGQSCSEKLCIGAVQECSVDLDCPSARGLCVERLCVERPFIEVTEDISTDTEWTPDNDYILRDLIFVEEGTLTIRAGTRIYGGDPSREAPTALIVLPRAQIRAEGTLANPIVFSSNFPKANRVPGNWAGVALLGNGQINVPGGVAGLEGLTDPRAQFGQGVEGDANCGFMNFVRIEYAGFDLFNDNELNGLTIAGCDPPTTLSHIQVHLGDDDGVEFFGGSADIRYLVVSRPSDDGLDWDLGWQGRAQFVIIQQRDADDNGIEADNSEGGADRLPRSAPQIYNLTITGGAGQGGFNTPQAMTLRRGTAGTLGNVIVTGHRGGGLSLESTSSQRCAARADAPELECAANAAGDQTEFLLEGAVFHQVMADVALTTTGTLAGFDIRAWAEDPEKNIQISSLLQQILRDPFNVTSPDFRPVDGGPFSPTVLSLAVTPPDAEFFDTGATYLGALAPAIVLPPNEQDRDWTAGWTAYPPLGQALD